MQKPKILKDHEEYWQILVESAETQELKAYLEKESKLSFGKHQDAITGNTSLDLLNIDKDSIEEKELQLILDKFTAGRKYAF